MKKDDFYWYWLNNIPGIGRGTIRRLLEEYEKPENIYFAGEEEISMLLVKENQREQFFLSKREEVIEKGLERLHTKKVTFLHPDSVNYPRRLCNIPDPPYGLYLKGSLPKEDKKAIAIIGARSSTRYGKEMARFFGRELSKCGISVISGLARGIDGMAHTGALEGNGYTLGVLGGGIDRVYPEENYKLFMQMEQTGGIISESNIGVTPVAGLFPQRNRLIAGFSDGILVIEAMEKSGTFITVDQGLDQGKEIFALPGRILDVKSTGCNNLIKLGAHMVTEVSDILEILHLDSKNVEKNRNIQDIGNKTHKKSLAPLEKIVYSCLRIESKYLDDIIEEVKLAPQDVCMILNKLVIEGAVEETTRNYYAIKL